MNNLDLSSLSDEEIKKRIGELDTTLETRSKLTPHRYYTPIGKAEQFINKIASNKYLTTLLSAANGVGKTYLAVNLLANLFWPTDNSFFRSDFFHKFPYRKKGRIISDPTTVTDTIIPCLKEIFPKDRYNVGKFETTKAGKNYEYKWETDTGWGFNIMTYEQETKEFESATLGWTWFDEPPPEAIYKATIARFRTGGFCFITATPLSGSAWMYDEIVANPNNEAGYRTYIEAEVEDACITHGIRGFLEHENIVKMVAQYDEDDKQARVFGKFQHLTGLVFKTFSRKVHVVKPFAITEQDFSVIELLDPHPRNEDAVMWVATDKYNRKFICDELYSNFANTGELAQRVKKIAAQYRIVERRMDPIGWTTDQHKDDKESLAKQLQDLGLDYSPASKNRQMGIRLIRNALHYQAKGQDESGQLEFIQTPQLYVFENCIRTIYEFEHWQYQEWTGKTAERKSQSERPQDKDDHMMENLGRALIDDEGFVPMPVKEVPRYHPLSEPRVVRSEPNLDPY